MIKPNFSESQLQQLINIEITMRLFSDKKYIYNPTVISLMEEFHLGWDTAFYFPWLLIPPNPKHRGCNFFIQYKLSKLMERCKGDYKHWRSSYLRFQIPYSTRNKVTKQYFDDYNQFDCLKKLASERYYVYYATNHVVSESELFQIAQSQNLLDNTPFLDVSNINGYHKNVSFTQESSYFLLHSEPKKIDNILWEQIYNKIEQNKGTSLSDDVKFLKELIIGFEKRIDISQNKSFHEDINRIIENLPELNKVIIEAIVVSKYLKQYLNIYWYRWINTSPLDYDTA